MTIAELSEQERQGALTDLPHWTYDGQRNALFREIVGTDFVSTFGLMTSIALEAEKADHHPEWSNVYNRLSIWLTTHDAGGVSERDLRLAAAIDKLAAAQR